MAAPDSVNTGIDSPVNPFSGMRLAKPRGNVMGLFDWLRGNGKAADDAAAAATPATVEPTGLRAIPATRRRFSLHRDDLFDLTRTATLHDLFAVRASDRDAAWRDAFFDAAWHGSTEVPAPTPFTGPDGFRYLRFDIPHAGAFESQSIGNLAASLVEGGVGAAIFASPDPEDAAQFVFSMGRLDAMVRFDNPEGDPTDLGEQPRSADPAVYRVDGDETHQQLTTRTDHQVLVGAPSADYLPPATAHALYRHLTQGWGIADPRVALMLDPAMQPPRSLIVGRRVDGFKPDQDVDGAMRMLLWYFPPVQMLMLQPATMSLDEMTPLSRYLGDAAPAND